MNTKEIETFFTILDNIMRAGGTWKEKRDMLLAEASDDDKTNLDEFAAWFDTDAES